MNKITTIATVPGKSGFEVFRSVTRLKKDRLTEIRRAMQAIQKTGGVICQNVRGSKASLVWTMTENAKEAFKSNPIPKTRKEMEAEKLEAWEEREAQDAKKRA